MSSAPHLVVIQKSRCIYGECRARNLCVRAHCVGAGLLINDGYLMENGSMRAATEEEKSRLCAGIGYGEETAKETVAK
jgi:hypothetical protein